MNVPRQLPNTLTILRLVLALVLFGLLWRLVEGHDSMATSAAVALLVFLLAALTDALDGWLARRFQLVTEFGRLADPFVDKIIICGALLFFLYLPEVREFLPVWVVGLICLREILVTGARGFINTRQVKFESDRIGKLKMILQCITVGAFLGWLALPLVQDIFLVRLALHGLVWTMLASTVVSGVNYAWKTRSALREGRPA